MQSGGCGKGRTRRHEKIVTGKNYRGTEELKYVMMCHVKCRAEGYDRRVTTGLGYIYYPVVAAKMKFRKGMRRYR